MRLAALAVVTAILSVGGFAWLSASHAVIATVCVVLAAAYSHARGAKATPFAGTLVHLVAQPLLFHLGYLSFAPLSIRSLALSAFFALLFAGGHLMHELKDHDADLAAGLRTNAVRFGRARMTLAYRITVSLSLAYWIAIRAGGLLPAGTFAPFGAAAGVHALACWLLPASGFESQRTILLFQRAYRFAYLVAGVSCFL
jgi:4-hydroxybenzoate polyprenyltransferase